ncbi:hypothetical protein BJV78DRAFT_1227749 [Lactifluus subvellereus]|nr:hypothetical protein BJV78DRAFT_1227749 [Lactifluus subvellereus]
MNSHQSSSNSRTQNIACSPFSLRTVVTAVHATIRLTFWKARRMGDEISEGRRARRGVALHHDNPVEVSSSECGKVDQPITIEILPDDVLLDIFDHHRLAALDYSFVPWQWHRLAHVCRRWRSVVFASPRRLDLRLVYTYKKPVRKSLDCWPPFPISIWYPRSVLYRPLAPADEQNVIAAFQHTDRIYDITLTITRPLLEKLALLIQKPFPVLQHLHLITRDMMWSLALPSAFLGGSTPRLRHIDLKATPFPTLPRLLLSAVDLVSLRLYEIPDMGYFSPEALVVGLYATPQLKFLTIRFHSPTFPRSQEGARTRPPLLSRAALPALSEFSFKGDIQYLEDLVARIDAPIVEEFDTTLFDHIAYEIPQLTQFICRTEELKSSPYRTSIFLWDRGLYITLYFGYPSLQGTFRLQTECEEASAQVFVLAHICRQLSPIVSSAECLDVQSDQHWPDEADTERWLELFSPFNSVRRIEVVGTVVPSVASALERSAGEMGQMVLPALQDLHLKDTPPSLPEIESFVAARRLSGHVVTVRYAEE